MGIDQSCELDSDCVSGSCTDGGCGRFLSGLQILYDWLKFMDDITFWYNLT